MRIIDRLIVFVFSLLLIGCAVAGAFLCFNPELLYNEAVMFIEVLIDFRWFVLLGSVLLLVVALLIMFGSAFYGGGRVKAKESTVSTINGDEQVQVSIAAIDSIVSQVIRNYPQVKSVSNSVKETADGVAVESKTVVNGDCNIPKLAKDLQDDVKAQLENMAGLKVAEIKIIVTGVVAKSVKGNKQAETTWDDVETEQQSDNNETEENK